MSGHSIYKTESGASVKGELTFARCPRIRGASCHRFLDDNNASGRRLRSQARSECGILCQLAHRPPLSGG